MTIVENGRQKQITKLEAAAKQLANKAASGDFKALNLLLPQLAVLDAAFDASAVTGTPLGAEDEAVLARLALRLTQTTHAVPTEPAPPAPPLLEPSTKGKTQ